jgi:hypothetical protein
MTTFSPDLFHGESDRPRFDPISKLRWDDRGANPDHADLRARHKEFVRRAQR